LTFDESRKLVLWDTGILREALYICIGADYNTANQASELTMKMDQYSSRARNVQFQATNVRGRIESIKSEFAKTNATVSSESSASPEEIEVRHRALVDEVDVLHEIAVEKQKALRDADLQWLERSARFTSLHAEYEREFSRRVESRSQVQFHPTVSATLSEDKCAICHSPSVATSVRKKIEHRHCPLCDSTLPSQTPDEEAKAKITKLDIQLTEARDELHQILQTKERLANELKASEDSEQGALAQLQSFESENVNVLKQIQKKQTYSSLGDMASTIARLEIEFTELTKQKREHYNNRDRIRKQLEVLQKGLKRTYAAAEETFVPMFQKLATAFLGINIGVLMEENSTISNFGVSLVLSMRGTTRRNDNQLSESQRFFVDIALRMALVQYISATGGEAEFLIDTPEGSLDIAYEARAGSMFAQFVHEGHNVFMTANINSSHLLLQLAKECGHEHMTLHRMTDWTDLSQVQADSEDLFDEAYSAIEAKLK
jgi:DNA repair exonuclease SbcCD ATPase subunit